MRYRDIVKIRRNEVQARTLLFIGILLFTCTSAHSQNNDFYAAYISNRMDHWINYMDQMEKAYAENQGYDILLDLTVAQYGYIAYCMSMKQKSRAKDYVIKAEINAKKLLKHDPAWARVHSLLAAIYGFKAAQTPYKAPVLGIMAMREADRAFALDPADPHIWMEKANIDLYKPAIFGGNKHDAIQSYLRAIELFEMDAEGISKSWLYLNTLAGLATAYVRTEQVKKADRIYRKIIFTEPDFKWIADDVYPAFRKKYF